MPEVGLFTATEPLSPDYQVVIKYPVEVEGLAVCLADGVCADCGHENPLPCEPRQENDLDPDANLAGPPH